MKTLLIIDKAGQSGLRYALVEGDYSKFNGVMLNNGTPLAIECLDFIEDKIKNNNFDIANSLTEIGNSYNKTALIAYF